MSVEMPLTQGRVALIDETDSELVAHWKWTWLPNARTGYAVRWSTKNGKRQTVYMHRAILSAAPGVYVDHINGNGLDNRRGNIRLCTQSQNLANRIAPNRPIPYRGVYADRSRSRFFAQGKSGGHVKRIGTFATIEDAARAYDEWAAENFGEFARLNFPICNPSIKESET